MFLGREISKRVDYSELTAQKIDDEVKNLVMGCFEKTRSIIQTNVDILHRIAQALLEKEVLDGLGDRRDRSNMGPAPI